MANGSAFSEAVCVLCTEPGHVYVTLCGKGGTKVDEQLTFRVGGFAWTIKVGSTSSRASLKGELGSSRVSQCYAA